MKNKNYIARIDFKDHKCKQKSVLFIIISIILMLFLIYNHAPVNNYLSPLALFLGAFYLPNHTKKIFRDKITSIIINEKSIILLKELQDKSKSFYYDKNKIEKFEVKLDIKNRGHKYFFGYLRPRIYCTFSIHIKTSDNDINISIPRESYSPQDYSLIFKFLNIKNLIPNFSYNISSDFLHINEEIEYFEVNGRKMPILQKSRICFKELPIIPKILLIVPVILFIFFNIYMLFVLFM